MPNIFIYVEYDREISDGNKSMPKYQIGSFFKLDIKINKMYPNNQPIIHGQTVSQPGQQHSVAGQTGYTNVAFTGANNWTNGQQYGWVNPHNLKVPIVPFAAGCKKCHGTGTSKSMFSGATMPCTRCYSRAGYCKKCYGTGTSWKKNKACTKCQQGKKLQNKSSSSSNSD